MAIQKNFNNDDYSYAPYNFIPLSKRVIERYKSIDELPAHNEILEGTLSGEITYTIENNTDLIISDGKGKFFKDVDGNYAIPGSTIRGKLRSNASILGFSTVAEDIQDEKFLYRRFASSSSNLNKEYKDRLGMETERISGKRFSILKNVQAGYIKKVNDEEYVIVKNKVIKGKTYFRILEKDLSNKYKGMKGINFMHDSYKTKKYAPYMKEISFAINEENNFVKDIAAYGVLKNNGFILGSGKMDNKKSHYIINEIDDGDIIKISSEDIRAYKKYYIKDKKEEGFYSLPQKKSEFKPVFYSQYNGRTYFGFTPYLRLFYDKTIHDGITKSHKDNLLDYNKSMFGFTDSKNSYKSRISVEDAVIVKKSSVKEHTMVLSEPKATCVHLYLVQDGTKDQLHSYNGEFEIRGIKYYWLKNEVKPEVASGNVNSIEEAIGKGASFKGKITFENLHEDELGLLLWSLYIHKDAKQNIGKGKPYGYGNISIKDIEAKVYNTEDKYSDIFTDTTSRVNIDKYISIYKEYAKSKFNELNDIEEDLAIKTFIEVNKNSIRKEKVNYMSLNKFKSYAPLSEPLEILGLKEKIKPKKTQNNDKNNNDRNNSYNKERKKVNNRGRVNRNYDDLGNGFSALKDFFK